MAAERPQQQKPAGRIFARKLLYLPIIHTQADMGALGESTARAARRQLGPRGWLRKVQAVDQVWREIEQVLRGLRLPYGKVRLYQDGLPVCGREEAIVTELARAGSRNHQILKALMSKGATLMGTESWELLQAEYRLARESLAPPGPAGVPGRARPPAESATILERRDRFMGARINDTLQAGETGILFVGMLHAIEEYLDQDIQVLYPCRRR